MITASKPESTVTLVYAECGKSFQRKKYRYNFQKANLQSEFFCSTRCGWLANHKRVARAMRKGRQQL